MWIFLFYWNLFFLSISFGFEALFSVASLGFFVGVKVIEPHDIRNVTIITDQEKFKKSGRAQPRIPFREHKVSEQKPD